MDREERWKIKKRILMTFYMLYMFPLLFFASLGAFVMWVFGKEKLGETALDKWLEKKL